MDAGASFRGKLSGEGFAFAVVVSRFNDLVTKRLLEGAQDAFERHGVDPDQVDVAWVPGSFDLPLLAKKLAETRRYDAVVCLGAVIRGETDHYEHVARQAAEGIARVALDTGVPCPFGVLTTDSLEQALERAGGKHGNKGYDSALAAIEMASLLRSLRAD
ncbi:MAG: 6,7-dimethyl-8-ribityllumazine synthase [Dehalococcoidia bacterium]